MSDVLVSKLVSLEGGVEHTRYTNYSLCVLQIVCGSKYTNSFVLCACFQALPIYVATLPLGLEVGHARLHVARPGQWHKFLLPAKRMTLRNHQFLKRLQHGQL